MRNIAVIKPTKLYVMTHLITSFKYLGQTTKDLNLYYGSSRVFTEHCKEWGFLVEKEVLLVTTDPNELAEQGRYYSKLWNVVDDPNWANLREEAGLSTGGRANPRWKDGKYEGRHDDHELYRKLDQEAFELRWADPNKKKRDKARMNFNYHKKERSFDKAKEYWKKWYDLSMFKDNNRQALWETDTFEMWYNRKGNDLNFRDKV